MPLALMLKPSPASRLTSRPPTNEPASPAANASEMEKSAVVRLATIQRAMAPATMPSRMIAIMSTSLA